MIAPTLDLSDPRWFPVEYLADQDLFQLLEVELDTLGDAAFLDQRLQVAWDAALPVPATELGGMEIATPPSFLFHTAFCGSTLLARALHAPPGVVSLKEPSVLHALSTASLRERNAEDARRLDLRLYRALALLSRPWTPGGRVVVKPTNPVNRLAGRLLAQSPRSPAILLYSSLREFMLSCFKKLPDAETKIRWMTQHLLVDSRLSKNLDIRPFSQFNLIESCALTWFAQVEYFADVLAADDADNLRTLDMKTLLAEPELSVRASASWLKLPASLDDLQSRTLAVFSRHSKSPGQDFGAATREIANDQTYARYGDLIERGLEWARREIEPAAVMPRDWKPLAVS